MSSYPINVRRPRAFAGALVLLLSAAILLGCGSSGRELRAPEPGQTAPPRKPSAAGTISSTSPDQLSVFGLASNAWSPGLSIPSRFTCDGLDVSPPLAIFVPPPESVELALVVTDVDSGFVHWIVTGIAPFTTVIAEGELPAGAVEWATSSGESRWTGPCPPPGEQHTYEFALYALDAPSAITTGQAPESVFAALSAAAIETSTLTGIYTRGSDE